jgi:hypothetical protein
MSDDDKSVFAKFIEDDSKKEQPPVTIPRGPLLRPIVPSTDYRSPPTEQLLSFLIHRWPKATITTKNILQFGPNCLRNRKCARPTAEILAENGWLTPLATRRYDARKWRIERGPSESQLEKGSNGSVKKAP